MRYQWTIRLNIYIYLTQVSSSSSSVRVVRRNRPRLLLRPRRVQVRPVLELLAMNASSSVIIGKQDYARTPFAAPQDMTVLTMEFIIEKRDTSQLLFTSERK